VNASGARDPGRCLECTITPRGWPQMRKIPVSAMEAMTYRCHTAKVDGVDRTHTHTETGGDEPVRSKASVC
jgi:hypothetical protein